MKNRFLKKLLIMLLAALCLTACGSKTDVQKAQTKEDTKKLADDFFDGLQEQSKYRVTSSVNGSTQSTITVDGDNALLHYATEEFPDVYMFMENGKRYTMYEGSDPVEDEFTYALSIMTVKDMFKNMLDGVLEQGDTLNFNSTLSKTANNKELVVELSTDKAEDGKTIMTGKTEGDRFAGYKYETVANDVTQTLEAVFEYGDDITVEIPEHFIPEPRVYKHIESKYQTMGEIIAKQGDEFSSLMTEDKAYAIDEYCQYRATLPQDIVSAIDALDMEADDYTSKRNELLKDLAIDDCVDFSEYVLDQEQLDSCIGKKVGDLVSDGFEGNGWSIWDEGSIVWLEKDDIVYVADVELPAGFDAEQEFEFEDLHDSIIKTMKFNEVSFAMMPME